MRIQSWFTAITGTLALLAAQTPSMGQAPIPPGPATYSEQYAQQGYATIPQAGYQGQGYYPHPAAPGGSADPSQLYPAHAPESFQPWPTISPFYAPNVGVDQHTNRGGLWFREMMYRRRDYQFSVEAMAIIFRDPGNATVGSDYARPFDQIEENPFGQFPNPTDPYFEDPTFNVDSRIYPIPILTDGDDSYNDLPLPYLYPVRSGVDIGQNSAGPGIQLRFGFTDEDYTGMSANGWWGFEQSKSFTQGMESINGVKVNQAITLALNGQNLRPGNGVIPLYNGESGLIGFGPGSTAKYDVLFDMEFETEAGGANLSFYQQPIYRTSGIMVRPLWGLRYMHINEGFRFRGIDSGFNYGVEEETHRPPNSADSLTRMYDQYEATLANSVKTHMAGPEIGLRFDLGGRDSGFKMWAETIFGLNVNNEEIHLRGNNIGDPMADVYLKGFTIPRMLDDANYTSEFNFKKSNTHVSPLIQQSIFADIKVLDAIPLVKESALFEDATFRMGYTFLWVGEVARPADSIDWKGFPLYPEIKSERHAWWAHQFNFGIDWHF